MPGGSDLRSVREIPSVFLLTRPIIATMPQGTSAISLLQPGPPAGASLHPLLSQAIGLAVFHKLFELHAVTTLDPDGSAEIHWAATPPDSALQFLAAWAISCGKVTSSVNAEQDLLAANLEHSHAIMQDYLPVPASFLQPTAALLHEFAVQMLGAEHRQQLPRQLQLYPAMNTIQADRWWPELLQRVS